MPVERFSGRKVFTCQSVSLSNGHESARKIRTGQLTDAGFQVHTTALYAMDPVEALPQSVQAALADNQLDGVLLYSRRTAAVFALTLRRAGLTPLDPAISCYCLSQAVADAVAQISAGPVHIAEAPTQISLFASLGADQAGNIQAEAP